MTLEFNDYVRRPFTVEAVEVTKENINEIADMIGKLRFHQDTGEPYIKVDPRKVPKIFKVHLGYFLTRADGMIRCYYPELFHAQFTPQTAEIMEWVDFMTVPKPSKDDNLVPGLAT